MVKITDVARHAGVSPSTVSYVLSGKRPISEETRRRVQASIRTLGYRPHAGARPAGGPANVLGLVMPLWAGVHAPTALRYAASVVTAARSYGHDVLVLTQDDGEEGLRRAVDSAPVDGLIVMDVRLHDPRLPVLRGLDRPAVLIGFPADRAGLTCVDLDFGAAAERCVDHLAELGHRAVALVGPPPEVYARRTARAQHVLQGFTAAAGRQALTCAVHPCEATAAAARATAGRLLREDPAPTGIVVHNEAALEPLTEAFAQLGTRVPEDLSVTAICPAEAAASAPVPLTSVALPAAETGERAVELLMRARAGEPVAATTLLPPVLTVRASTARRTGPADA
ncbi:LacI family DNA-binding transcriptional regulator [Streptomyces glaucescens]|uniref:LacI family transcriptional regulator n=1 Tax=Streptomyces glaucescens TaxID=1907 RepID=A0A089XBZ1_STRGA|nr:LacI family DNA-binding transcriptional regulator [Streptomyces glaucescens]AIR98684.1 LacI family transcriptional regulator [Streptomyces glaucescens]